MVTSARANPFGNRSHDSPRQTVAIYYVMYIAHRIANGDYSPAETLNSGLAGVNRCQENALLLN
jgi:hypothetical protein